MFHAKGLLHEALDLLPADKKIDFKFPKACAENFKHRDNLKLRRVKGDDMSADQNAIESKMTCLKLTIVMYVNKNVWNDEGFSCFYYQLSS